MYNWKYFTLSEFTKSETAEKLEFLNIPMESDKANLDLLVRNVLDPLRENWGGPIKITSGYRCARLNKIVGGVKNSQHLYGKAADIVPIGKTFEEFVKFLEEWLKDKEFDQCIIEKKGNSKWIHISYNENKNRKNIFSIVKMGS